MKYISINEKSFSKVVLGTNPIYGRSHFSQARSAEYAARGDDEYIKQIIATCLGFGVDAVGSSANERIQRILEEMRPQAPTPIHFIGNTRVDHTSPMKSHQEKFNYMLQHQADIVVIHSRFVDRPRKTDEIGGLRRMIDKIHAAGLIAGISTHRISTVELCESQEYGIDVYLFPLNATGFVYPGYDGNETVDERIQLIQSTPKPFVLMKTMGAGRIPPQEGLQFALDHAKDSDIITLGLGSVEEAEESLNFVQDYLKQVP